MDQNDVQNVNLPILESGWVNFIYLLHNCLHSVGYLGQSFDGTRELGRTFKCMSASDALTM